MAGAFHGASEPECTVNVGVSGPGVVLRAIKAAGDVDFGTLASDHSPHRLQDHPRRRTGRANRRGPAWDCRSASSICRWRRRRPRATASRGYWRRSGLDSVGTHGSTAALALLNDAVKKGGAMASSYVGGLSGAFIPLSEDAGMIEAAERGAITIDKLEAMTAVCSVGLDMIAIPGDTPAETIAAIIADEAAIGMINKKDHGRAADPRGRQARRRLGRLWRPARPRTGHRRQHAFFEPADRARRPHTRRRCRR